MTIDTQAIEQVVPTAEANTIADPELSFSDYEKLRRGETLPASEPKSAPTDKSVEQKEPTESDTEETEEAEEQDESENDSEKEKPKKKGGFQRRIDKLNAAKTEAQRAAEDARREAEHWKSLAQKSADETKAAKVESKADADGEPDPEEFDTHAGYVKAVTKWTVKMEQRAVEEKQNRESLAKDYDDRVKAHHAREKTFSEKTSDYGEVMADFFEEAKKSGVNPFIEDTIISSENGPELMYELAKNLEEFKRINALPYGSAAREFGKFEAKLLSKASEVKPEPPKLTKAPKPIEPVGSGKGTVAKSIDDPNLSFADYERLRREQMKRRGA